MTRSIETVMSASADLQERHQKYIDASPRRRRLYELIIAGFRHLLSQQQSRTYIDGRGAGYVVWIPRRERYQRHQGVFEEDAEEEKDEEDEEEDELVVLYGSGYAGLLKGGLVQALDSCDCLSPPLRWVRIPLELLPPPASAPSRSNAAAATRCTATRLPPNGFDSTEQYPHFPSAKKGHRPDKPGKYGLNGGASREDGVSCTIEAFSGGEGSGGKGRPGRGTLEGGRGGTRGSGEGGGESGGVAANEQEGTRGGGLAGVRKMDCARNRMPRVRQREVVDLWWLTDPPAPKVSAEALRLQVATETVQILRADAEEVPDVVCTIEVCQGRPYLPGRLQRFPNVATSTGPYRPVHSYRVPARQSRSVKTSAAVAGEGREITVAPARTGSSLFSLPGTAISPSRGGCGASGEEESAWISITDLKPSHWYNVRHRYTWRVGGGVSMQDGFEEVVTATRHVHTEAYFPPVPTPPKPYAILACFRRQLQRQGQQTLHCSRPPSRERGDTGDGSGLAFYFRLRWGAGARGVGRGDRLFSPQLFTPQDVEYILQMSTLELPGCRAAGRRRSSIGEGMGTSDRDASTSAKKVRSSSPTAWDSSWAGLGSSNHPLRSTGATNPGTGHSTGVLRAPSASKLKDRPGATWCPSNFGGNTTTTNATAAAATTDNCTAGEHNPANEDPHTTGGLHVGSKSEIVGDERDFGATWGGWTTVLRTSKTREAVELPRVTRPLRDILSQAADNRLLGLRYRVGARRRDTPQKAVFGKVLEVPTDLLQRLYEIEEMTAAHKPSAAASPSKKRAGAGDAQARRRGRADPGTGLQQEEADNFLRAYELWGDGESFPARVAWELQSEFWPQEKLEDESQSAHAETEARVNAEAKSIQRTLEFSISASFIAGVIREIDATAGE